MGLNVWLPFPSAIVIFVFAFLVFRRYRWRGGTYLLLWGIGLVMYGIGSLSEAYTTAIGWNPVVFRLWYLFGAMLVAAWLGQGTVHLLWKRWSRPLLIMLILGSLYGLARVASAKLDPLMLADGVTAVTTSGQMDEQQVVALAASAIQVTAFNHQGKLDERRLSPLANTLLERARRDGLTLYPVTGYTSEGPNVRAKVNGKTVLLGHPDWVAAQGVSVPSTGDRELVIAVDGQPAGTLQMSPGRELYGHAIVSSGVRILTPFFNIYGTLTLVGGAIYSAWIFLRKRIMPNRVIGNVLIATGALMPAIGGTLSRFGLGGYLYLGELLGAILMFIGFVQATSHRPEPHTAPSPTESTA